MGQRLELGGFDHAPGQPDPRQRTVGRLMHVKCAGTGVLVAGAVHPAHGTRSAFSRLE